ncbi:PAS domain-containing protein [Ilumatobacter fluminis]|uniref:PAS domain-containing protein n=1 Tax=Ilumatobacter fluminis TaxID=467091 RepID=A0A4R7I0Z1_9ACTN|nr:SpoIIE family protein phosphatase [Ilumatobacter fluminis]TDT17121.1 PAS domain-containing protein [Ilumatobacter fluminis]
MTGYLVRGELIDLHNCEDEPIHIPGSVQPHGALIAFDADLVVQAASSNISDWFGNSPDEIVGSHLGELLDDVAAETVEAELARAAEGRVDEIQFVLDGDRYSGALYASTGWFVLELEAVRQTNLPLSLVRSATMELNQTSTIAATADAAAAAVREITGFDRVMVYRFDEQWNGQVIAERKRDDLNTFLGLRYPSTDIPAQARDLYRRNWLRVIPDIHFEPAPIEPHDLTPDGTPLDLSDSTIRSVSPIHVEYLSHMGVTASMSISLIIDDELWGLIACHHYSGPHRPPPPVRNTAEYIGQLASVRLGDCERNHERQRTTELTNLANALGDILLANDHRSLTTLLAEHEADVLKLANATGAAIRIGDDVVRFGTVPPAAVTWSVLDHWSADDDAFACEHAASIEPGAEPYADVAAGILAMSMSGDRDDLAVWFRPEQVEFVDWAGDPYEKEVAAERPGVRLAPRRSFELWREVVRGRSEPWAEPEMAAAYRFTRHLISSKLRRDREAVSIADDLMKVALPARLPSVPGYALDAHYAPDGQGRVGGDWYDVVTLGDRTAFVVGDVAGHGLRAASTMTQARNSLRAYLADDPDPTVAAAKLDRLLRTMLPGELVTLVVAVLDHESSRVRLCGAGHLPPLVIDAHGAQHTSMPVNRLLGAFDGPYEAVEFELVPGQMLLMYSDGLVEKPGRDIDEGLGVLRRESQLLAEASIDGWAERLADLMAGLDPHDDVTALAVRRL